MELYLPWAITDTILQYMTWFDLRHYNNRDGIWKRICDYFCADPKFCTKFNTSIELMSRKERFLFVMEFYSKSKYSDHVPKILWDDKAFVLLKVQNAYDALSYTNDRFKGDIEIVSIAIESLPGSMIYVDPNMEGYRALALKFVQKNWHSVGLVHESLRSDQEFMYEVTKLDPYDLCYASLELRSNKEFILKCVKSDERCLQFVSDSLQDDKEVVLAAIQQNGMALEWASDRLKNDKVVVLTALRQAGMAIRLVSHELRSDQEVIFTALKQNSEALYYINSQAILDPKIKLFLAKRRAGVIYDNEF